VAQQDELEHGPRLPSGAGLWISETGSKTRKSLIQDALNDLNAAKNKFGSTGTTPGLSFTLGEGNLLF
jgi:hypothetical protein